MDINEIKSCVEALEKYGTQAAAAEALGLSRSALRRRLEKANNDEFLEKQAAEHKFPADKVSSYWMKTKEGSFLVKNDTTVDYDQLREQFIEDVKEHAIHYPRLEEVDGEYLLIIDPADVHFGKLAVKSETGKEYNLKIAEERLINGIQSLLNKANMFNIDKIVFVLGNDNLHTDTPFNTTTKGTYQDCDGMWHEHWNACKKAYIKAIEICRDYADVKLIYCPSNHDFKSGHHMADTIASWFHNDPHVDITDSSLNMSHRKYIQYGVHLIGLTHGDGAKEVDLQSIMQYECREEWGYVRYATWLLHHVHHKVVNLYGTKKVKQEKAHTGVTVIRNSSYNPVESVKVEYVDSPSESDGWHDRNGYIGDAAIECFMFHRDNGSKVRFTEVF